MVHNRGGPIDSWKEKNLRDIVVIQVNQFFLVLFKTPILKKDKNPFSNSCQVGRRFKPLATQPEIPTKS
jgi:hypothetical protein